MSYGFIVFSLFLAIKYKEFTLANMPLTKSTVMSVILTMALLALLSGSTFCQKNPGRAEYIAEYSGLAVSEMRRSGIPASITMAQAILESSLGKSDLATKANNHFGIKCHVGWEGKRFYYEED